MDYNDKLKLAKEALESGSYDRETIEYIFPELAESEDERIRNLIYCLIRDRSDNKKLLEANGCSGEKALAWLEKQKEQKPIEQNSNFN